MDPLKRKLRLSAKLANYIHNGMGGYELVDVVEREGKPHVINIRDTEGNRYRLTVEIANEE